LKTVIFEAFLVETLKKIRQQRLDSDWTRCGQEFNLTRSSLQMIRT